VRKKRQNGSEEISDVRCGGCEGGSGHEDGGGGGTITLLNLSIIVRNSGSIRRDRGIEKKEDWLDMIEHGRREVILGFFGERPLTMHAGHRRKKFNQCRERKRGFVPASKKGAGKGGDFLEGGRKNGHRARERLLST